MIFFVFSYKIGYLSDKELNMNKVMLIGNLGQEPIFNKLPNGTSVCTLILFCTTKENGHDNCVRLRVVTWGKLAESCQKYLQKNSVISVEGQLEEQSFTPKGSQSELKTLQVKASHIGFLDKIKSVKKDANLED